MSLIAILDYGVGNLRSVQKALEKLGFSASITKDPQEILKSKGLILPGVGAFDAAMQELTDSGLDKIIKEFIATGKPFLGLCLGLQLLFSKSEEGKLPGLDLLKGESKRFDFRHSSLVPRHSSLKIPQMGWNTIKMSNLSTKLKTSDKLSPEAIRKGGKMTNEGNILRDIPNNSYMYFVHSYYVVPKDPKVIATTTDYGIEFCSTVAKDNIFATQYHPEKSGDVGLRILKNFGELCKS